MSNNDDRLLVIHNQGQEDASENVCRPPHSIIEGVASLFIPCMDSDKMESENAAYYQGQENHRNQTR